jgi:serine protease Do
MNKNRMSLRKNQMKKLMKKGATLSLCAVLAGGIAAGTYEGVNRLTGWNDNSVQAAVKNDNEVMLIKSDDTEDSSEERAKGSLDVSDIVEEVMPSVVSITTKTVTEVENYYGTYGYGYGFYPGTTEQEVEGSGSGIIVGKSESELLIATNYHVVEDAQTVTVTFVDGTSYECSAKGYDEDRDLAVVAVSMDDIEDDTLDAISIATIGSSDDLKVGEQVVAIGNALGYGQSVTTGIVSAKNRKLDDSSDDAVDLIQTDAAINPGNSGGALLNMNGEVVGINSAKMASTEVEGMGYAISISDVADVLEKLMNEVPREKVEGNHGILGITGSTVSDEARQYYGIPEGVYVADVTEGGAADQAGIKKNYIIKEFDGKDINTIDRLVELLEYYEPGEEVEVVVEVPNEGEYIEKTVTVTLGEDTSSKNNSDSSKNNSDDSDYADDLEEFFFGQDSGQSGQSGSENDVEEDEGTNQFWN